MEKVLGQLIGLAPFVMVIFVVWFGTRAGMNKRAIRAELQKDILAKFSTGQDLSEFLATDAGKRFMREPQGSSKWAAKGRVINLAVAGIIAVGAGIGFYFGGEDADAAGLFIGVGLALLA